MIISKVVSLLLIPSLFFFVVSCADGALSTNPIAPTSVNVCDSNAFLVYVNNIGTTSENDIHLHVTIPPGFYYDGNSSITFPGGSSNTEPSVSGQYLEWNLTEIMTTETDVVINELLPNPAGSDSGNERVELYNAGPATVNVSGWYINDAAGNKRYITSYIVSGSVNMTPGSFLVVGITGAILNNPGDTLFLFSEADLQKDSATYGTSVEGLSWACMPDASKHWDWRSSTLGATNGHLAPDEAIEVEFNLTAACGTPSGDRIEAEVAYSGGSASQSSSSIKVDQGFLNVIKTPAVVEAGLGDVVSWTVTIENGGQGPAYNVRANDTLSPGLSLLSTDSPGGEMNWSYDVIGPSEVKTVNISANITVYCDIHNTVNVSWGCGASPCQETYAKARVNVLLPCIEGYKIDNNTGEGIPGWTVSIYNDTGDRIQNTSTDSSGWYHFCDLWPGNYTVCEEMREGWTNVSPRCISVEVGFVDVSKQNFTNAPLFHCIDGYKYDYSRKPLENWTIVVTNSSGHEVGENTTDDEGYWQICGLPIGDEYTVCEVQQKGWAPIDPPGGCYHNVTLKPGENTTLNFCNEDPRNLTITKVADKYEVKGGDEVTYTITVCNRGGNSETNVTVWDVFNRYVEVLSYSPAPGPDGKWHFDVIPQVECVTITIKVTIPERQDFEFRMEQGVSGEGFVNVANGYSTTFEAYLIKNCAYATSDWSKDPISACVTVTVDEEVGTRLETSEYGSGLFDVEERVTIFTENKSIEWMEDLSAIYKPTTLTLYNNRTVSYDSAWVKKARAKNYVTGTTMTETYHAAASLDRDSRIFLDENESMMEVSSEFDGMGHIGFLKMPSNASTPGTTPLFEASEDYTGSFKVLEKTDEYGSAVTSEKAASGEGLVVADKRVGDVQRSYESGSGTYDSEEIVETYTNYIAKDISLVHAPTSHRLTDDVSINSSMKWKEGMYSKNPETSYIGEEYTSITELEKKTVARGLNEMETEAEFSGQARYRAVLERNGTDPEVDFDESYTGDYSIERRVIFTGVAKYDRPHLNVTKTLDGIVEETVPWGYGEKHLEGETKTRKVANYFISIENDGNKALGPIYVQDLFPPGSAYIEASVRPTELMQTYANWTLMNIGIGDLVAIELKLDVSEYSPSELVNRVEVCGGINNGEDWVCASNFSALEVEWLTCCPGGPVSVETSAEVDKTNDAVVRYKIEIRNVENVTRVATVTDWLPEGMELLDSSIPFASYDGDVIVWNLVKIPAFGTATIEFLALVPGEGRFTNTVEVDARSVDGPVVQPVTANCVIDVDEVEVCGETFCTSWSPPNWEFESPDEMTELSCEELICEVK